MLHGLKRPIFYSNGIKILQNISESAASEKKRSYEYDPVTPRFWFVLQLECTRFDHMITFSYTLTPPSRHINPYSYRIGP